MGGHNFYKNFQKNANSANPPNEFNIVNSLFGLYKRLGVLSNSCTQCKPYSVPGLDAIVINAGEFMGECLGLCQLLSANADDIIAYRLDYDIDKEKQRPECPQDYIVYINTEISFMQESYFSTKMKGTTKSDNKKKMEEFKGHLGKVMGYLHDFFMFMQVEERIILEKVVNRRDDINYCGSMMTFSGFYHDFQRVIQDKYKQRYGLYDPDSALLMILDGFNEFHDDVAKYNELSGDGKEQVCEMMGSMIGLCLSICECKGWNSDKVIISKKSFSENKNLSLDQIITALEISTKGLNDARNDSDRLRTALGGYMGLLDLMFEYLEINKDVILRAQISRKEAIGYGGKMH